MAEGGGETVGQAVADARRGKDRSSQVMVVAPQGLWAEGLVAALRGCGWSEVEAVNAGDAATVDPSGASVALVALDLGPTGSALELIGVLAARGIWVLALWDGADRYLLAEALEAGAMGAIDSHWSLARADELISVTVAGMPPFSGAARAELLSDLAQRRAAARSQDARFDRLSPREGQVLALLMTGRSTEEIAAIRFVSVATVRTQIRNVLTKLGVNSQLAAVALAVNAGWSPRAVGDVCAGTGDFDG